MTENAALRSFRFELFADYFQFYIQDESAKGDLSESWSQEAIDRMLAIAPGTVGVATVRNTDVPVVLEIMIKEPVNDFAQWDHVAECGLAVTSNRLVVAGCTDYFPDAARVEIIPGEYRVRASFGTLDKLPDDGLDGEDRYRIQIWPGPLISPRIVKSRKSA